MQVLHIYVAEKDGTIGRSYDFLRQDDKDGFTGFDVTIPYDKSYDYPILEHEALTIINNPLFGSKEIANG